MIKLIVAAVTDTIVPEKALVASLTLYKIVFKITRYTITPNKNTTTRAAFKKLKFFIVRL